MSAVCVVRDVDIGKVLVAVSLLLILIKVGSVYCHEASCTILTLASGSHSTCRGAPCDGADSDVCLQKLPLHHALSMVDLE
jgi:hypothetical protein